MMTELAVVKPESVQLGLPGEWTRTGWLAPSGLEYDDWEGIGTVLSAAEGAVHWWIGDWLNYGERKWGEMYAQAMDETQFSYKTLAADAWVSQSVQFSRRRENLSWSHHREVAALEPQEQDYWLDQAENQDWTRNELRRQVQLISQGNAPALPPGIFAFIYADPPWQYANTGFSQSAAQQYPTMSTEDICMMPIESRLAEHSVLFLWVTAPLLPDGVQVLHSWGFEYKTCLVWKKDRAPGVGWYCNTKHELLFIGAKGTGMHPTVKIDSVIEAPVTRHSAKPQVMYELIESMYAGPYLELFARTEREGWTSWGNEIELAQEDESQREATGDVRREEVGDNRVQW
jgi:N6-adenosine-specific RNA methylase IME4